MYLKFYVSFPKFYPPIQGLYDPTGMILATLNRAVTNMFPAKYQPNVPGSSVEEIV